MNLIRRCIKAAALAAFALVLSLGAAPALAFADSANVVTLGTGLTADERTRVLEFFGLTESDLQSMKVINVDISDERSHLAGTLPDSVIGNKTMSCSYIQPTTSGGINVETANLTYVTKNTLYNALQTAGVQNANLVVTAPYKVSGTGALTGVFMAYEADGKKLDEAKTEAATQEMVDTAELESKYGTGAAEVVSDVKDQVVSSGSNASADQIRDMIAQAAKDHGIQLSDQDIDTILSIIQKVQSLDYDKNAFSNTLDQINSKLDELSQQGEGFIDMVQSFFKQVGDWFSQLFAMISGGDSSQGADGSTSADSNDGGQHSDAGILGNLNEDVFQLDSGESGNGSGDSTSGDGTSGDQAGNGSDSGAASADSGAADTASGDGQAASQSDASAGAGASAPAAQSDNETAASN